MAHCHRQTPGFGFSHGLAFRADQAVQAAANAVQ